MSENKIDPAWNNQYNYDLTKSKKHEPAFPCDEIPDPRTGTAWPIKHGGMSLRDYFAAKSMQALIISQPHLPTSALCTTDQEIANVAYRFSDAMLKEREK